MPGTEQDGVLSPGPSLRQNIQKVQRVTARTIPGTGMTIVINGPMSGRVITIATDGFMAGTSTTTTTTGRTLGESLNPGDECRTSHWETTSWCSSHWETSGWKKTDKCSADLEGQQWLSRSFFETMNMDQLINSLLQRRR